jgi:glyoxylate utilization-related uncharacterized protein
MNILEYQVREHYTLTIDDLDGNSRKIWNWEILIAENSAERYRGKAYDSVKGIEIPWAMLTNVRKTPYEQMLDKIIAYINE